MEQHEFLSVGNHNNASSNNCNCEEEEPPPMPLQFDPSDPDSLYLFYYKRLHDLVTNFLRRSESYEKILLCFIFKFLKILQQDEDF